MFCIITLRKTPKSIFPETGSIFWISSFWAGSPRTRRQTCSTNRQHISWNCGTVAQVLVQLLSKKWTNQYPCHVYGSSTMGVKKVESCLHVPRLHLSQFDLDFFSSLLQSCAGGGSRSARSLTGKDVKRCLALNTTNAAVSCGGGACSSQRTRRK